MTPQELEARLRKAKIPIHPFGTLTAAAMAKVLDVHPRTLSNWIRDGLAPPHRLIGTTLHFPIESLAEFLSARTNDAGHGKIKRFGFARGKPYPIK
jgi:hypothetical protein